MSHAAQSMEPCWRGRLLGRQGGQHPGRALCTLRLLRTMLAWRVAAAFLLDSRRSSSGRSAAQAGVPGHGNRKGGGGG